MTDSDTETSIPIIDRGIRAFILGSIAVAFVLVVIVTVGIIVRIEGVSTRLVLQFFMIAILFWPMVRLKLWEPGVTDRVREGINSHRIAIAVTTLVIFGSQLPAAPGLLTAFVRIPFTATSGYFFGAEVFYRQYIGFALGESIRKFAEWYIAVLFVLLIAVFAIRVSESIWSTVTKPLNESST